MKVKVKKEGYVGGEGNSGFAKLYVGDREGRPDSVGTAGLGRRPQPLTRDRLVICGPRKHKHAGAYASTHARTHACALLVDRNTGSGTILPGLGS